MTISVRLHLNRPIKDNTNPPAENDVYLYELYAALVIDGGDPLAALVGAAH